MSKEPVDKSDIQGLVYSKYPECRIAEFFFLSIHDGPEFQNWLKRMHGRITHAGDNDKVALLHACNIAITPSGMERLNVRLADSRLPPSYIRGTHCPNQQSRVGDVDHNAPHYWHWGAPQHDTVDVMMLTYAMDVPELKTLHASLELDSSPGFSVVHSIRSSRMNDGREHFGFRDGINQPELVPYPEIDNKKTPNRIALGEFLFDHRNQDGDVSEVPILKRTDTDTCRGSNGTYMVFRQLEQDVEGFWNWLGTESQKIGLSAKELAEKIVGLSTEGFSPADTRLSPKADGNFGYAKDREGLHCPVESHVRRANPRDGLFASAGSSLLARFRDFMLGTVQDSRTFANRHRIIRRSMPYGSPVDSGTYPGSLEVKVEVENWILDSQSRGLNFICLNADLGKQFELIQNSWLNSPKFADLEDGVDPVAGVPTDPETANFTIPAAPIRKKLGGIPQFVRVRGSAYFMMPSISTLKWLAGTIDVEKPHEP